MIDYTKLSAHDKYELSRKYFQSVLREDWETSSLLLTLAVEGGDCAAAGWAGAMHLGVEEHYSFEAKGKVRFAFNVEQGVQLLERAAQAGDEYAQELLRRHGSQNLTLMGGREYYCNKAVELICSGTSWPLIKEAVRSLVENAKLYEKEVISWTDGVDVQKYKAAWKYCKERSEDDDGSDTEEFLARHFLKVAADCGDAESQYEYYFQDCEGDFSCYQFKNPDAANGLTWLKQKADAGDGMSMYNYGLALYFMDTEKIPAGAEYWEKAADCGVADAACELAMLYDQEGLDYGDVWPRDRLAAIKWYKRAVELGDPVAGDNLGSILYDLVVRRKECTAELEFVCKILGMKTVDDLKQCLFKCTELGTRARPTTSPMRMVSLYAEGIGVAADDTKAREWIYEADSMGISAGRKCFDLVANAGMTVVEAINLVRDEIR